ncbi:hypothetical protein JCM24511_04444 [Saitozyma sp. JCM 24511]|nr:hypothetical protein JCM24511_04444 [Saitozyma sp. JCM 24511]
MSAAASTSMHTATQSILHQAVEHLASTGAEPLNIERHRDRFQERALRDVTVNSSDSAMALDPGNPTIIGPEMEAQKDHFRRLKFNYLEQEAKRNFLFSITGDEPQGVQPGENEALEQSNAEKKAALKAYKAHIDEMRGETIELAKSNAARNPEIKSRFAEAQALQKSIRDMELELARIKAKHPPENRLTVPQANEILDQQINDIERLTEEISTTGKKVDVAREEVSRTAKEVQRLGREREREEARAKEVREGREAGDTKVDELCQWLSSSIATYRKLMGIRSVRASVDGPQQLLHIEYEVTPAGNSKEPVGVATLVSRFDGATRRLANAQLQGSDMNIEEAVNVAKRGNDVPGLVADVLMRLRPQA